MEFINIFKLLSSLFSFFMFLWFEFEDIWTFLVNFVEHRNGMLEFIQLISGQLSYNFTKSFTKKAID